MMQDAQKPSRALKPICTMLPSTLQHGRTCQPFSCSALMPLWHHSTCIVGALLSKVRATWSQKPRYFTNQANSRDDLPLTNGQLWAKGDGPQHEQDGEDGVRFYHATEKSQQFKLMNWLVLKFSISYYHTMGLRNQGKQTLDKGRLLYKTWKMLTTNWNLSDINKTSPHKGINNFLLQWIQQRDNSGLDSKANSST